MQQGEKKRIEMLVSIFLSICSIFVLIFTAKANLADTNTICLWILGCIYLAIFNYFGVFGYAIGKIGMTKRKGMIIGLTVVLTVILYLLLPFQYDKVLKDNYFLKNYLKEQTIKIEPVHEQDIASSGTQIWLEGIKEDGQDYNLYNISLVDGWTFVEDRPFTDSLDAKSLEFRLNATESYAIMLRKGPNFGKVKITIGANAAIFDLYQEKYEQRAEIDIKLLFFSNMQIENNTWQQILYNIIYILILSKLSLTLSVYVFSFMKREKKLKEGNGAR